MTVPKPPCPICGDPNVFRMWLDEEPPLACPYDEDGSMSRGPMKVRSVTDCPYQMTKARQRAQMMKVCPDAFDERGNMRPGGLAKVMKA